MDVKDPPINEEAEASKGVEGLAVMDGEAENAEDLERSVAEEDDIENVQNEEDLDDSVMGGGDVENTAEVEEELLDCDELPESKKKKLEQRGCIFVYE